MLRFTFVTWLIVVTMHTVSCCEWNTSEEFRKFVRVPENAPVGLVVAFVSVSQPQQLRLSIPVKGAEGLFQLSQRTGANGGSSIVVSAPLSQWIKFRPSSPVIKLTLMCGQNPIMQQITVYIDDVNDHSPVFLQPNITVKLDELTPVGLIVLPEIRVSDGDKMNTANSEVELDLVSAEGVGEVPYFEMVDKKKGSIRLIKALDFDVGPKSFLLEIVAKDLGTPPLTSTTTVTVEVGDADDLPPMFAESKYKVTVQEHPGAKNQSNIRELLTPSPSPIRAFDGDSGLNVSVRYLLVLPTKFSSVFDIDPSTGELFLTSHLDRELISENPIMIHVQALQTDNIRKLATAVVEISLEDVNDHLAQFVNDRYAISIVENLPVGFSVLQVEAFDEDQGSNSAFTYHVIGDGTLAINSVSGWLTVANQSALDREIFPLITLLVCTQQSTKMAAGFQKENKQTKLLKRNNQVNVAKEVTVTSSPFEVTWSPENNKVATPLTSRNKNGQWEAGNSTSMTSQEDLDHSAAVPLLKFLQTNVPSKHLLESHQFGQRNARNVSPSGHSLSIDPVAASRLGPADSSETARTRRNPGQRRLSNQPRPRSDDELFGGAETFELSESSSCAPVEVTLLDANDNNPRFVPSSHYEFVISDLAKEGEVIGQVKAVDPDEGFNGRVRYQIDSSGAERSAVTVNKLNGSLTLTSTVTPGQVTVLVEAHDSPLNPSEKRISVAVVNIIVEASSNGEPRFIGPPFEFWVGGDAPVGTSVGQVRVADFEEEVLFDLFHSYSDGVPFAIEETTGIVSVITPLLQFPTESEYHFEATASDARITLASNLTVHVAPIRRVLAGRDVVIQFTITENLSGGIVGDVLTALRQEGVRVPPDPHLELISPDDRLYFELSQDAILFTVAPLDFEAKPNHTLAIVNARTSDIFYVTVLVQDVNDNPPHLNSVTYSATIPEDAVTGSPVKITPKIMVTDRDTYPGSSYSLHLQMPFGENIFQVMADGDIVFVGKSLDREMVSIYHLILLAVDDGNLTSIANLTIVVEDVNDNAPKFSVRDSLFSAREGIEGNPGAVLTGGKLGSGGGRQMSVADLDRSLIRIAESLPMGSSVTHVTATDEDENNFGEISYALEKQLAFPFAATEGVGDRDHYQPKAHKGFTIDGKTGLVLVAGHLLSDHFYILNVSATDGGGLRTFTTITVAVMDVNDHSPQFDRAVYQFQVTEGEYLLGEIGRTVARDQDSGTNGELHYELAFSNKSEEQFPFQVSEAAGTILVTGILDRELRNRYEFSVVATDRGNPRLSSSAMVHIDVIDVNDNAPKFAAYHSRILSINLPEVQAIASRNFTPVYHATISENIARGIVVGHVTATDADSPTTGNGMVLFKLAQRGQDKFAVDSQNGTVYTIGRLDYEQQSIYNLTVIATDLGSPPMSSSAIMQVTISDVEEEPTTRLFDQEEYYVQILENNDSPFFLLELNVSGQYSHLNWSIELVDDPEVVSLEDRKIFVVAPLDREKVDQYRFKLRAVTPNERNHTSSVLYNSHKSHSYLHYESLDVTHNQKVINSDQQTKHRSSGTRLSPVEELDFTEVFLVIDVIDVNDNAPVFAEERMVAAVPSTAGYGYPVAKMLAKDADEGINAEVRYHIESVDDSSLPRGAALRFSIDSRSGQITVVASLEKDSGKTFQFDVTATDRRGAVDGRITSMRVMVHVLTSEQHLVVEIASIPLDVERNLLQLQKMLVNISGLDVRVQKIAPHTTAETTLLTTTDVFVYAFHPVSGAVVDATQLKESLGSSQRTLRSLMPPELKVMSLRVPVPVRQGHILQTPELAILIGAVVVFLLTVMAIVCICYRQRKNRLKPMPMPLPTMMTAGGMTVMPLAYPAGPFGPQYMHMSEQSSASAKSTGTHVTTHFPSSKSSRRCSHSDQEISIASCHGSSQRDPPKVSSRKRHKPRQTTCSCSQVSSESSDHYADHDSDVEIHQPRRQNGRQQCCHDRRGSQPNSQSSAMNHINETARCDSPDSLEDHPAPPKPPIPPPGGFRDVSVRPKAAFLVRNITEL